MELANPTIIVNGAHSWDMAKAKKEVNSVRFLFLENERPNATVRTIEKVEKRTICT